MNRADRFTLAATVAGVLAFAAPAAAMTMGSAALLAPPDAQYAKDAAARAGGEGRQEIRASGVPEWYAASPGAPQAPRTSTAAPVVPRAGPPEWFAASR